MKEIEAYELNICVFKADNGDYEYIIAQEFDREDGVEEVEFIERGSANNLYDAVRLAADAVERFFDAN